ncbi:hypothetical protein C8R43DRAFT_1128518 [Mycena crocata]|nr:hypothetical protein C8R43DRAFT_1128518 [Mycena crocata]
MSHPEDVAENRLERRRLAARAYRERARVQLKSAPSEIQRQHKEKNQAHDAAYRDAHGEHIRIRAHLRCLHARRNARKAARAAENSE